MKKLLALLVLALMASPAFAKALLAPGDAIIAVDPDGMISTSAYPDAEAPMYMFDGDVNTKYLNFGGWNRLNTGFIVTPTVGSSTVQSFQISTANDASSRDPMSYMLYGTNDAIIGLDNSKGNSENWTLIDSGSLSLPDARRTAGDVVTINNTQAYTSYKMMFPETKNGVGGGLMQISEVDFFDGVGTDLLSVSDVALAVQETPDSCYPQGENPSKLIDGTTGKYLNFGKNNSGFIVTPSEASVVRGFDIMTANDAPERDPASWILYGTNDVITSEDNSTGTNENWVIVDTGLLALSDDREVTSDIIVVDNETEYSSYKMIFPTLKDAENAPNSLQIGEIQFYDVPEPATMALLGMGGLFLSRRRKQA